MAFMAVVNPGDEVLISSPYWVSYPEQVKRPADFEIIRGEERNGFKITPRQLADAISAKNARIGSSTARATPAGMLIRRRN